MSHGSFIRIITTFNKTNKTKRKKSNNLHLYNTLISLIIIISACTNNNIVGMSNKNIK